GARTMPERNAMSSRPRRIRPLDRGDYSDAQAAIVAGWDQYSMSRVLVQHPELYRSYSGFGVQVMRGSTLPVRDRVVLIIRTIALCGEGYEAPHHDIIAREIGLTESEVDAVKGGGETLDPPDRLLVKAADELVRDHWLSEATWQQLTQRFALTQAMEVVFL